MTDLLRVCGLAIAAPDGTALVRSLDLTLAPGGRHALLGESGSGKTSTALAIAGLLAPGLVQTGRVEWPALGAPAHAGRDIGFVFQEPLSSLNPVLKVGEQIAEPLVVHGGLDWPAARARAGALMQRVGLSSDRMDDYPHRFSGGQRQRIAIAMAVAAKPQLLIADEPTSALDTLVQQQIVALLDELVREEGMALLLITHDLGLAQALATQGTVLRQGEAVEQGPLERLLHAPDHAYTRELVAAAPDVDRVTAPAPVDAPPLLQATGLSRRFDATQAVDDASIEVRRGETVALIGGSGSGKTTLGRLIVRLTEADAGALNFDGVDLLSLRGEALRRVRPRLQMVFQDPLSALNPLADVRRLLTDPLRVHALAHRNEWSERVADLLRQVDLSPDLTGRRPHELSGGQRQRVNIARALATAPDLIVLDEPLSSLDVSVRGRILDLLRDAGARRGMAYLFISHDLAAVRAFAQRVYVMADGRIVEQGETEAVLRDPQHEVTRALLAAAPRLR